MSLESIFYVSSVLAAAAAVMAIFARPWLGRAGRGFGVFAAFSSMLLLPYSLVTYPTGLAAWILLGSPELRSAFGGSVGLPTEDSVEKLM